MIRKTACLAGAVTLVVATAAHAADGFSAELGTNDDVTLWRVGAQWCWARTWSAGRTWRIGGYWDLAFGRWYTGEDPIYDIGFTPVFRLERREPSWPAPSPYFEAAIGFHVLSDLRVDDGQSFSTKFQFGDHLGAGVRFGEHGRYDLSLRVQHLSNGGIRRPNPGINFVELRLAYHLR